VVGLTVEGRAVLVHLVDSSSGAAGLARRAFWLSFLGGLGWALVLFVRSPGASRHDEIAHYLIARHGLASPPSCSRHGARSATTCAPSPRAAIVPHRGALLLHGSADL
jgi:hypothetical protein